MQPKHPLPAKARVTWSDHEGAHTGTVDGWDQDLDVYFISEDRPVNEPVSTPRALWARVPAHRVRLAPS
jgi:hypothetical protein